MIKYILVLMCLFALTVSARDNDERDEQRNELLRYMELKNSLYTHKLEERREKLLQEREAYAHKDDRVDEEINKVGIYSSIQVFRKANVY